jgi:hypothetical protein
MIRKLVIFLFLSTTALLAHTQNTPIVVNAKNKALNAVLIELRDQYGFQLSYSDNQLSNYHISVSKTFHSKEETLQYLIKKLPFQLRPSGEVFIIIPDKKKVVPPVKTTKISGQIIESGTFEPLPFSHILINKHQMVSDVMGSFNYIASTDSSFHLRISHLGYFIYDTILYAGINQKFTLTPSIETLSEITVKNNIIEKATLIGEKSGKMKLNHNISRYLPGQGDNSIFNLLRLLPGIQAAGEQSTDLLIWGSYEGHSQVTFDEFILFGLKNYNDNISVVNPLMVKNIEIFKGGYEAKYGNRVGGIVNITGKNGNLQHPSLTVNINQSTLNGLIEIPLFKRSSLMLAYRQTYYNLYDADDFNIFAPTRSIEKSVSKSGQTQTINFDINVYPDEYKFRDFNLKYTYNFDNGDRMYLSGYQGGDTFSMTANTELTRTISGKSGKENTIPFSFNLLNNEKNKQKGIALFYGRTWKSGHQTQMIFSHSEFNKSQNDEIKSENLNSNNVYKNDLSSIENTALESSLRIENTLNFRDGHQLEMGIGTTANKASLDDFIQQKEKTLLDTLKHYKNNRVNFYLNEKFSLGSRLMLKGGVRTHISPLTEKKFFVEPRLSASYQLNQILKINASWGIYNQFIYKIANINSDNNYTYHWISSDKDTPVLHANHWIAGISTTHKGLTINIEAYYKTTNNLIQRISEVNSTNDISFNNYTIYRGNAMTYGIDNYIKYDFGRNSIWASYTLSKVLEQFSLDGIEFPDYQPAPHDQRHEIKLAALFNIKRFYLSANSVYGSGMEILREMFDEETQNISYLRVDAAISYRFRPKHFSGDIGFSILNIFDTQNLKMANIQNITISQDIGTVKVYSDAIPFTPTLYLKLKF